MASPVFGDLAKAYDALDNDTKALLEKLEARLKQRNVRANSLNLPGEIQAKDRPFRPEEPHE